MRFGGKMEILLRFIEYLLQQPLPTPFPSHATLYGVRELCFQTCYLASSIEILKCVSEVKLLCHALKRTIAFMCFKSLQQISKRNFNHQYLFFEVHFYSYSILLYQLESSHGLKTKIVHAVPRVRLHSPSFDNLPGEKKGLSLAKPDSIFSVSYHPFTLRNPQNTFAIKWIICAWQTHEKHIK